MYKAFRKAGVFILLLFVILALNVSAVASDTITVDASGLVSWEPIPGAVEYEYTLVSADYVAIDTLRTPETSVYIPEGYCIHVCPIFADGSTGDWMLSDFFGEPADSSASMEAPPVGDSSITVDASGLVSWEPIPGAVEYEYTLVSADYVAIDTLRTPETSVYIPEGYCIHVCPIFADGTTGDWMLSDFFGEPADSSASMETPPDGDSSISTETPPAGDDSITMDASGLVSWEPVPGAVAYEYHLINGDGDSDGILLTEDTFVQLPVGYSTHVMPLFADGSRGEWMISDYFGEPGSGQAGNAYAASIIVDENGLASWNAVPGAVEYICHMIEGFGGIVDTQHITETCVQLPAGYSVHVLPVYADGSTGILLISDYFGEPISDGGTTAYVDNMFTVKWETLSTYDVISAIDHASVKALADGGVYFEAAAPNGSVMRFICTGVTVDEGTLTFAPGSRIAALDAIGRICAVEPIMADPGSENNSVKFTGGYTFTDATSVDSLDDLFFIWGFGSYTSEYLAQNDALPVSHMSFQPNFIAFGAESFNTDSFTISQLNVYYDESVFNTGIRMLALDPNMYGTYMEGEHYDPSREVYSYDERILDFYLQAIPDVADEKVYYSPDPVVDDIMDRSLINFDDSRFTIGDLKAADGTVLDKRSATLDVGSTLEVTLGDYTLDVQLPVLAWYTGAQTLHELTPYNNACAQGDVLSLVVPVFWQDQPEYATEDSLDTLRRELGRVMDAQGQVTDYSAELTDSFSLSEYYDIASYNQYHITSFVTDWYAAPYNFAGDMESSPVMSGLFATEVYTWLFEAYPDMDWSRFDRDADGFLDSVILVNFGQVTNGVIVMSTYGHAVQVSPGYTGEGAGTPDQPALKNYISMNASFLNGSTLIHEHAHEFGLVDYYDVTYSGIDAVGSYDMQSGSHGDWNAYSKYAAGWITPEIVEGLASGESVDVTIGAFAATGDAIVIPAAGTAHDGPFGEYVLIDLFTSGGVNEYDAAAFGLDGVVGVRIYHISSPMEKRVLTGTDGVKYPIGTVHYTNVYNEEGKYLIELVQSGGDNTFTDLRNLRTYLTADDLFTAGDVFTAEAYAEFFTDGLMDDGSAFGYAVEIVQIDTNANGEPTATIRVTRR